jgi:DNA polymerase III alpha subunit
VKTNSYGEVELTEKELFDALYTGKITSLENVFVDSIERFNQARGVNADRLPNLKQLPNNNDSIESFDKKNQATWFIPETYKNFNMVEFLLDKTENEEQYQRVVTELELFIQYDMMDILVYCKYLVDVMRENNILWGVGRGSSVASYVLYLIGIHKIDSIKYCLDINEFLK